LISKKNYKFRITEFVVLYFTLKTANIYLLQSCIVRPLTMLKMLKKTYSP